MALLLEMKEGGREREGEREGGRKREGEREITNFSSASASGLLNDLMSLPELFLLQLQPNSLPHIPSLLPLAICDHPKSPNISHAYDIVHIYILFRSFSFTVTSDPLFQCLPSLLKLPYQYSVSSKQLLVSAIVTGRRTAGRGVRH